MLARVAESLNWMARYIERAEDVTRLLAVNFNALLDTTARNSDSGWEPIVTMNGDAALFNEIYGRADAQSVIEFLLWHPLNPNAVTACVTRARENARSVRERSAARCGSTSTGCTSWCARWTGPRWCAARTNFSGRCATARRPFRASPRPP